MSLRPHKLAFLGLQPPTPKPQETKLVVGGQARIGGRSRPAPTTSQVLDLSIRMYGGALPPANPLTLRCFLNRDAGLPDTTVDTTMGGTCTTKLCVPNSSGTGQVLHIWCYAQRALCDEKQLLSQHDTCSPSTKQLNVMRLGFLAVELQTLRETGIFGASLCDVDYVPVGSCDLWISTTQFEQRSAVMQDKTKIERQLRFFTGPSRWMLFEGQIIYLHETHPLLRDTNITELGHRVFSTINSSAGTLPMWSFPYEMYRSVRSNVSQEEGYRRLLRLLDSAEFFTGQRADSNATTPAQMAVLLDEIVTLRSRACCYVLDSSLRPDGREYSLDEWTFISDNPVQRLVAYDCEEGACDGIATLSLLTAPFMESAIAKHQGLRRLREAQLQYTPLMAIVTLRMMATERHSYHAIVLDLDSAWLARHIESNAIGQLSGMARTNRRVERPAVAMEFTMYSAGCWQDELTNETRTRQRLLFKNSQLALPLPSNAKAPADMVDEVSLYGHVHTVFTPSLVDSHGICQLICTYRGKLGIPVPVLMHSNSGETNADVIFIPVRSADQAAVQQLDRQFNCMPLPVPLDDKHVSEMKQQKAAGAFLIFDAAYRQVDLEQPGVEDAIRQQISALSSRCVISRTDVEVSPGMTVTRLQAWL